MQKDQNDHYNLMLITTLPTHMHYFTIKTQIPSNILQIFVTCCNRLRFSEHQVFQGLQLVIETFQKYEDKEELFNYQNYILCAIINIVMKLQPKYVLIEKDHKQYVKNFSVKQLSKYLFNSDSEQITDLIKEFEFKILVNINWEIPNVSPYDFLLVLLYVGNFSRVQQLQAIYILMLVMTQTIEEDLVIDELSIFQLVSSIIYLVDSNVDQQLISYFTGIKKKMVTHQMQQIREIWLKAKKEENLNSVFKRFNQENYQNISMKDLD